MRKITFLDLTLTPWKNGAGTTRQLWIHPADATLDTFAFRISAADVNALGPFSNYAGINRSLAVLSGQGLTLTMAAGHNVDFTPKATVVDFDGGQAPSTTTCPEPILDIGVMSRMGIYTHTFTHKNYQTQQTHQETATHGLLFCLHDQPITLHSGLNTHILQPFDALAFEHSIDFRLTLPNTAADTVIHVPFFLALLEPTTPDLSKADQSYSSAAP